MAHSSTNLDELMKQRRYAQILQHSEPDKDDPQVGALRSDAQELFQAGVRALHAIYADLRGTQPPDVHALEELRSQYYEKAGDIYDPDEAAAYTEAMLNEAERWHSQGKEADEVRSWVYAAQTLPNETERFEERMSYLLRSLESSAPASPPPEGLQDPVQASDTAEPGEDSATSEVSPRKKTVRLRSAEEDITDPWPREDADEEKLRTTLADLKRRVQTDPDVDLDRVGEELEAIRPQIDTSSHKELFEKTAACYRLRREEAPQLEALLERPMRAWLEQDTDTPGKTHELLATLQEGLGIDSPVVERLKKRQQEWEPEYQRIRQGVDNLASLNDPTNLGEELQKLEEILGADYPGLQEAQQKRSRFAKEQQEREADAKREKKRKEYEELRDEFDTALEQYIPNKEVLNKLLEKARNASHEKEVTDNPFDEETVAYYELITKDLLRSLESTEQSKQTVESLQDQLEEIKTLQEHLRQAAGDKVTERGLQEFLSKKLEAFTQSIQGDITNTTTTARSALSRSDYEAALRQIESQQTNLAKAREVVWSLEIDPALETTMNELLEQARSLERDGQAADTLCEEAEDLSSKDDYRQAVAMLQQAAEKAPWRKEKIQKRIDELQEAQERFFADLISRIGILARTNKFDEAETPLQQAHTSILTEEQRQRLQTLELDVNAWKRGTEEIESLRKELTDLMYQARGGTGESKEGQSIDVLQSRAEGYRIRIGTKGHSRLKEEETWQEMDGLLGRAEEYLRVWKEYNRLVKKAETAASEGNEAEIKKWLEEMKNMSYDYDFLPFKRDDGLIREWNQKSKRAEWARKQFETLRDQILEGKDIDIKLIIRTIENTEDLVKEYPDIANERQYFQKQLSGYQKHEEFQKKLSNLFNETRWAFDDGWKNPNEFREAASRIVAFAQGRSDEERKRDPRLGDRAFEELISLADRLFEARESFDAHHYAHAEETLKAVQTMLTFDQSHKDHPLSPYYNEVQKLRANLRSAVGEIETRQQEHAKSGGDFAQARSTIITILNSENDCFDRSKLSQQVGRLAQISDPVVREQAKPYLDTLRSIISLQDYVDQTPRVIIQGEDGEEGATNKTDTQHGRRSKRTDILKNRLNEARRQSEEIRSEEPGNNWLAGIEASDAFKDLENRRTLVRTMDEVDAWQNEVDTWQKEKLPMSQSALRGLRVEGERLKQDLQQSSSKIPEDLPSVVLKEHCRGPMSSTIDRRLGQITGAMQEKEAGVATRNCLFRLVAVLLVLLATGGIAWSIPTARRPVQEGLTSIFVGTLTPTPLPGSTAIAEVPSTSTPVVVTATPTNTPTPTLTPTPVPPHQAIVTVPGTANVRQSPNLNLDRVGVVTAGDDVLVTGFADEPDGTRWYRIDLPESGLNGVWLLATITVRGTVYDSVRLLDNGGELHPALGIPWDDVPR